MEAFGQILQGLVDHPTACILALTLVALAYFYRAREADARSYIEKISTMEAAHRATLEKVIPVADKLGDAAIAVEKAVATLERLMEKT